MFDKVLDYLIGLILVLALIPTVITTLNPSAFTWSAVNLGGTTYNFSFVPYILGLVVFVALIYFGLKMLKGKHQ